MVLILFWVRTVTCFRKVVDNKLLRSTTPQTQENLEKSQNDSVSSPAEIISPTSAIPGLTDDQKDHIRTVSSHHRQTSNKVHIISRS